MGFAKSIKSLFKGKKGAKEKEDNFNPYENSKQKATVGRNKVQFYLQVNITVISRAKNFNL